MGTLPAATALKKRSLPLLACINYVEIPTEGWGLLSPSCLLRTKLHAAELDTLVTYHLGG